MSNILQNKTKKFRQDLEKLDREDLIEILRDQDPEIVKQINRIEWVFKNKLNHLSWANGEPITERPITNKELSLLVDEPFEIDNLLLDMGISAEQQRQIHIAKDPCIWAKNFLGAETRVYQTLILRDPSLRKVLRAGRRLGKTFSMAIYLLHYSYTHKDGRSLVIAPMKSHVELIYQEIIRLASKNEVVSNSIIRKVTSPQFMIQFSNGSTIRFFTSGMRSGGKSDVARGQEAHVIVLDEMDYMHADDLDALYVHVAKTAEINQIRSIGALLHWKKRKIREGADQIGSKNSGFHPMQTHSSQKNKKMNSGNNTQKLAIGMKLKLIGAKTQKVSTQESLLTKLSLNQVGIIYQK